MADWKLSRRHPACVTCEHVFDEGERHYSRLEVTVDQIQRQDVCGRCWPAEPEAGWIWWRARREAGRRTGLQVDWDVLERVFTLLGERTEERLCELRYLLALLLLRKRRLMLVRATRHGDGEALVLRRPRRKDEILVRSFDLAPERMDELRAELQRLFEGGDELATFASTPSEAAAGADAPAPAAGEGDAAGTQPAVDSTADELADGASMDGLARHAAEPAADAAASRT